MTYKPKLFIPILITALIIIYWQIFSGVSTDNKNPVLFQIKQGQSWTQVAENLENAGLIRSDKVFDLRQTTTRAKIYPGRYRIPEGTGIKEIIKIITNPDKTEISITIPEGFGVRDIDERLADMGLIIAGEFTTAALQYEGFLFPDTYNVYNSNFKPEDLIKKCRIIF